MRVYANLADMMGLLTQQKLSSGRSVCLPSYPEGHRRVVGQSMVIHGACSVFSA